MSEQAGSSAPGPRHHKPKPFAPIDFEPFAGGADPARVSEAAHLAAQALVRRGRDSDDPKVTKRLVKRMTQQEALATLSAVLANPSAYASDELMGELAVELI